MKILAVDTSTLSCSVAVVDRHSLLSEATIVREQTHSKHLMELIDAVLGFSGLKLADIDGLAVTRGPGTFTGLRIGVSSVKGLALATAKPLVGVSSLEALAMQCAGSEYLVCPLIDARKGEVYFSRYRFKEGIFKREVQEKVLPPAQAVSDIQEPCLLVGSGAVLYHDDLIEALGETAFFAQPGQNTIRASTVAYLSIKKFLQKDTDDLAAFVPCYVRKSDAQINL